VLSFQFALLLLDVCDRRRDHSRCHVRITVLEPLAEPLDACGEIMGLLGHFDRPLLHRLRRKRLTP